jgi:hypothetical protein
MHLVQILLPLLDNDGHEIPRAQFDSVAAEVTARFGGLTAYTRSPAQGRWNRRDSTNYDDVIVLEVMVKELDRAWWAAFRRQLEHGFRQEEVVVRAQPIERL